MSNVINFSHMQHAKIMAEMDSMLNDGEQNSVRHYYGCIQNRDILLNQQIKVIKDSDDKIARKSLRVPTN